ncbi:FunK1 protein kinase [Cordyceps javanica]|uniref:EKC/KEOPS complex subunit BUD32 n=1 Tax=Cordyceps javanica TaxID=43265 RepID=A0A545VUR2_9HYPO|nr:FunK1 protein kinase [Cordyceps javanica]TQW05459.1 FunK1 protein kinase [Cordyceps javanica]
MTDQDLGKSSIIETGVDGNYINLDCMMDGFSGRLHVEDYPIATGQGLVGTGTACYRAKVQGSHDWKYALKLKWQWAQERPENELLNLAKEKCAWGAVSLDYYKELENTANLRRGLRWGHQRKYVNPSIGDRHYNIDQETQQPDCNVAGLAQYTQETSNFFQKRILICTITSPLGRPLRTFQSHVELLQVFRDAIKCHRSLYYDAEILHRDISPGNIIIVDHQDKDQPKGILIDLDSAINLDEASEAGLGITGTRPFMAIGVLRKEPPTYRHDLESFLYVLLWTIITNHAESPPAGSRLRQWSNGDWDELAARKSLDMAGKKIQDILGEFGSEFDSLKPLVEKLHQLLFPLRDGAVWTGTDATPVAMGELYEGMIAAFEGAITSEGQRLM